MKKVLTLCLAILFLFSLGNHNGVKAVNTSVDCSLTIPAQNQIGKSVHAAVKLSADQACDLGAILLTIRYDSRYLTFKEAKLMGSGNATIDTYAEDNTVKILFLSTSGFSLSPSAAETIQLRFMASAQKGNTAVNIMGEQAVTQNEQHLTVMDSLEYTVALQEKEVTSTQSASGRRVVQSTSSSKNNKSSSVGNKNKEENDDQGNGLVAGDEEGNTWKNKKDNLNLSKVGTWFENNITLFIWGIAFAAGLAILLFLVYKIGKKQAETKGANTATKEKTEDEKPQNETIDTDDTAKEESGENHLAETADKTNKKVKENSTTNASQE